MTIYPITLLLPNGQRRCGAIRAMDWDAAVRIAQRQFPGARVQPLEGQVTIVPSSSSVKVASVAARSRA